LHRLYIEERLICPLKKMDISIQRKYNILVMTEHLTLFAKKSQLLSEDVRNSAACLSSSNIIIAASIEASAYIPCTYHDF